ncbi:gamma-glutamyltransferase family protein [Aquibaculum sediminis]|uniref:gamma-glutamyltransferase family protein n=1 Tax=Aquibaculum sediminis TaxID=3231907 RepID=UPI003455BD87
MRDFQKNGRSALYAGSAAVATSHPLASMAAVEMLRSGGNAVDAALTACAVLCVVEPHMTGIGGDCFALYAPAGASEPVAINGSGRAASGASLDWYRQEGFTKIPEDGAHGVVVPGSIAAWCRLAEDHGRKDIGEILAPAIRYAEEGYVITPRVAWDWEKLVPRLANDSVARELLLVDGKAPALGTRHGQPKLGATLRRISLEGAKGFYSGPVAEDLVGRLQALGGHHTLEDFAAAKADYVTPVSTDYRGYRVYECPPNGQGIIALMILNILSGYDMAGLDEVTRTHLIAEATKQGYAQRDAFISDPAAMSATSEQLLSEATATALRARISPKEAADAPALDMGGAEHRDTICLSVVDEDGNAISFINSLFHGFGSCVIGPESGVVLNNRASSFRLEPGHINAFAPGKRPMHTIIPGMVMQNGEAMLPFGVMGGHYQASGHAAFLTSLLDEDMNLQTAIDRPRSFAHDGVLALETGFTEAQAEALRALGHKVNFVDSPHGGAQAIRIDRERGALIAASDPRKDGCALGW